MGSAAFGCALALFTYLLLYLTRTTAVSAMFFQKSALISWVPPLEVFLASWGAAMLIQKYRLRRAQEAMLDRATPVILDLLPERITISATSPLIAKLQVMFSRWHQSFLLRRIVKLLARFDDTGDRSEVRALLATQSEIDGTALKSSYTMLRVFIWAIPILGFIGTVIGLQEAIKGFVGLNDIERLQQQLAPITSGLGGAFQATLIALSFSLLIMFPTSASEKAEWRLLNYVDDYCNDLIIPRLGVRIDAVAPADLPAALNQAAGDAGEKFAAAIKLAMPEIVEAIQAKMFSPDHIQKLAADVETVLTGKSLETLRIQRDLAHQMHLAELQAIRDEIQDDGRRRAEAAKEIATLGEIVKTASSGITDALDAIETGRDFDTLKSALERVSSLLDNNGRPRLPQRAGLLSRILDRRA
ncbi:MAG TPA: MotA/TolQ/ExbB proton channel family protein [Thermoanaerobaculia bacterium]|nr:MotA/TolQ/ExbB proton channel family protein [Thermoanaerobaculia bacterium]